MHKQTPPGFYFYYLLKQIWTLVAKSGQSIKNLKQSSNWLHGKDNFYGKFPVIVGTGSQAIDCCSKLLDNDYFCKLFNGFVLHVDQEHFTQCPFE